MITCVGKEANTLASPYANFCVRAETTPLKWIDKRQEVEQLFKIITLISALLDSALSKITLGKRDKDNIKFEMSAAQVCKLKSILKWFCFILKSFTDCFMETGFDYF